MTCRSANGPRGVVRQGFVMTAGGKSAGVRVAIGVVAAVLLIVGLAQPASAQGLFERLFGGFRHHQAPPPANSQAFVDPFTALINHFNPPPQRRADSGGPTRAFCVRTCDGRYFPVQASPGMSAAEACHAFCPASQTQLYAGGNIDYAAASDGSRYADSQNAFLYRKQLVAGCTCNGRDAFGLAHIDAASDPTLRPGDVVATESGLMAVTATRNRTAEFTPVGASRAYSQVERDKLSKLKVQENVPAAPDTTASIPPAGGDHSAQLAR